MNDYQLPALWILNIIFINYRDSAKFKIKTFTKIDRRSENKKLFKLDSIVLKYWLCFTYLRLLFI